MQLPLNFPAARLALSYLFHDPASLLPHAQIQNLLYFPLPFATMLPVTSPSIPKIRAMILDKDNTLCPPDTILLHPVLLAKLDQIRSSPEFSHSDHSILIVSNTAGSTRSAAHEAQAKALEAEARIPVLRQHHDRKKPFCGRDIMDYFSQHGVTSNPAEVVVVGDRLATDVLLAREMGAWSLWVRDGFRDPNMLGRDYRGRLAKMEGFFERIMTGRFRQKPPLPSGLQNLQENMK